VWASERQASGNTDPVIISLETQRQIAEWVNDPLTLTGTFVFTVIMVALVILSSVRPVKDSSMSFLTFIPAYTVAFVIVAPIALVVYLTHFFDVWGVGIAFISSFSTLIAVKYILDLWMASGSPGSALSSTVPEPSAPAPPTPDRHLIEVSV
jgi:hypothetical protein